MTVSVWEAIFMLVVLKIPLIYLGTVVWWAVRAEPDAVGWRGRGERARTARTVQLGRLEAESRSHTQPPSDSPVSIRA